MLALVPHSIDPLLEACRPPPSHSRITDTPSAMAAAFGRALSDACSIDMPVFVTETGTADLEDARRREFINVYMGEVCVCRGGGGGDRRSGLSENVPDSSGGCVHTPIHTPTHPPTHPFFKPHLVWCGQVEKAVLEGHDVRGLMYWTLTDNFVSAGGGGGCGGQQGAAPMHWAAQHATFSPTSPLFPTLI
jgi:hypothetical protein